MSDNTTGTVSVLDEARLVLDGTKPAASPLETRLAESVVDLSTQVNNLLEALDVQAGKVTSADAVIDATRVLSTEEIMAFLDLAESAKTASKCAPGEISDKIDALLKFFPHLSGVPRQGAVMCLMASFISGMSTALDRRHEELHKARYFMKILAGEVVALRKNEFGDIYQYAKECHTEAADGCSVCAACTKTDESGALSAALVLGPEYDNPLPAEEPGPVADSGTGEES